MKLLIVTQAVDQNDPILGFFCRWLTEFAKHFEKIEVICLQEGEHHLPENVRVHSLGKEEGRRLRLVYASYFGWLVWKLRKDYDSVLVHMNPEYVILAGLDWRLMGKPIAFWYNHPKAGIRFSLAAFLADVVFYTSPYAASAHYRKAKQMPVGIDTELFSPRPVARERRAMYMQGRIMSSKHVHIALEALRLLRVHLPATLTLVGPENAAYGTELRTRFQDLIDEGAVHFLGPRRNEETPALYRVQGLSINLAPLGHFDKSVLESMACETPVVAASDVAPPAWRVLGDDPAALAEALERMISLPEDEYRALGAALRATVVREHSLPALAGALAHAFLSDTLY